LLIHIAGAPSVEEPKRMLAGHGSRTLHSIWRWPIVFSRHDQADDQPEGQEEETRFDVGPHRE
jgi:hypothetical protein